ncbi:MAG: ABC transporter permease [Pikeienuella sp.]|uniref:ABC transporter permease n=1 Tax=Pikeienuella sp. TaxID=2831957 RepID=UPI00391A66F0
MADIADTGMASAPARAETLKTADGTPLKAALAHAAKRARRRAFLLVAPLLAFVVLTFVAPIGQMLYRSVANDGFSANMPNLVRWFAENPETEPDESAYAALAADLALAAEARTIGVVGTRINYDVSGTRSLFTSAGRRAGRLEAPYREALLELDEEWGSPALWSAMRAASAAHTPNFYIAALDRQVDPEEGIVSVPDDQRIYMPLFWRTMMISAVIAGICLLLGFPVAHLLATLPMRISNLLMILVLLPFWTSLLVRTTSWMVLLQSEGVVNDVLVSFGVVADDARIQMMYNQTGTIVAMTHILLPFMILPLYSVMRTIPPSYVRAARSLGANNWTAFWRVYVPQTVPGIGAGVLLVFILAVGYYITPALVGGSSGQLFSNMIAFHMTRSLNWSMAAALAALLLGAILLLYWLYDRLIGIDNMKFG